MEAILDSRGNMLLVAETEFERAYLKRMDHSLLSGRIKTGASQADIVGLKLEPVGDKEA